MSGKDNADGYLPLRFTMDPGPEVYFTTEKSGLMHLSTVDSLTGFPWSWDEYCFLTDPAGWIVHHEWALFDQPLPEYPTRTLVQCERCGRMLEWDWTTGERFFPDLT